MQGTTTSASSPSSNSDNVSPDNVTLKVRVVLGGRYATLAEDINATEADSCHGLFCNTYDAHPAMKSLMTDPSLGSTDRLSHHYNLQETSLEHPFRSLLYIMVKHDEDRRYGRWFTRNVSPGGPSVLRIEVHLPLPANNILEAQLHFREIELIKLDGDISSGREGGRIRPNSLGFFCCPHRANIARENEKVAGHSEEVVAENEEVAEDDAEVTDETTKITCFPGESGVRFVNTRKYNTVSVPKDTAKEKLEAAGHDTEGTRWTYELEYVVLRGVRASP